MLFSDSIRVVKKAKSVGVNVTLQEWEDMPHVFQGFGLYILPEAKKAIKKIGEFVHKIISD